MKHPRADRLLGLSPRARRVLVTFVVLIVVVLAAGSLLSRRLGDDESSTGPRVGPDLHAVAAVGVRTFVGGHAGAGFRDRSGQWRQIGSLDDKDVMAWAATGDAILAGGHGGLYSSVDAGEAFDIVDGAPVSDVHGLGAYGQTVYLASPEAGVLVSTDGGNSFTLASREGADFMGTIWVDPSNAERAIAPSMQSGAVITEDGGASWSSLGGPIGAMSVAAGDDGASLFVIGMDGSQQSTDGGQTWANVDIPEGTAAAFYTLDGDLILAALSGERAHVYKRAGSRWDRLT